MNRIIQGYQIKISITISAKQKINKRLWTPNHLFRLICYLPGKFKPQVWLLFGEKESKREMVVDDFEWTST